MKTIDEEIWAYIDGSCDAAEIERIDTMISTDERYRKSYQELMQLNQLMVSDELEEPSMSFNRNVMEAVALEIAPKKLTTKVNNGIIYSIAAFFILSITAILVYVLANSRLGGTEFKLPNLSHNLDLSQLLNPLSMKIFLMFDLVLLLLYMDRLIRRKIHKPTH